MESIIERTEGFQTVQPDEQQQVPDLPANADAVISFEKTDIQFWMQVATVVLLYLIWRELQAQNRGGA